MPPETPPRERRIVALVLPDLLCELALEREPVHCFSARRSGAFGVVLASPGMAKGAPTGARLAAVSDPARARGVLPGQTLEEATALLAHLRVYEVSESAVQRSLERIAEVALGFGQPVSWQLPDTVWVDVTGSAHLWGGEQALAEALVLQVRGLGHQVRLAMALGPVLAQAFARWGEPSREGIRLVPSELTAERLEALPLLALPLPPEITHWFASLGVLSIGQLRALPPSALAARLGRDARRIVELAAGRDETPLTAHQPAPLLVEEIQWEEALEGGEPLFFGLRGLSARLSARLEGRGEAARQLWLELDYDPAWARLHGVPPRPREAPREAGCPECPGLRLKFALAAPLWREAEIERVGRARLERLQLKSPLVALRWIVPSMTRVPLRQQTLGRESYKTHDAASWGASTDTAPQKLSILLAKLTADVKPKQVNRLRWVPHHRPEVSSVLEPVSRLQELPHRARSAGRPLPRPGSLEGATRLLPRPVPFAAPLRAGELVGIGGRVYLIESVRFEKRLEAVEWWTPESASRDYLRVWLAGPEGGFEAFVFVDRLSGQRYLQTILD